VTRSTATPCPICPVRFPSDKYPDREARLPERPQVDEACRAWLAGALRDLVDLAAELGKPPPLEVDLRPKAGKRGPYADTVAARFPSAPVSRGRRMARVSGTPDKAAPISLTGFDLLAHVRRGQADSVTDRSGDQYGPQPVAVILGSWVQDWRQLRNLGEHHPARPGRDPEVGTLVDWLTPRLEWACDQHPAVADFAGEIRWMRGTLRAVLSIVELPEYKTGVPCRRCDKLALFRVNGSNWIECGECPELMSADEYERWTGLLAEYARTDRGYRSITSALTDLERPAEQGRRGC
jgi:hypothetical protein